LSRVRFHIQQESDIPASTQLYNQICFAIAARHYPPGHRLPSTRQLAMQTGLHRNTISKVYRQLETDGVVEAMAGSGIYVRDQQKPRELKPPPGLRTKILPDIDRVTALIREVAAAYIAAGLDPERNIIFNFWSLGRIGNEVLNFIYRNFRSFSQPRSRDPKAVWLFLYQ
jgi:DNA-binding transcriptional regulator YhcF (GntR family)